MNRLSSPRRRPWRRGAATVEFALCAPIFFTLIFAGIELSRTNMLIHTVESATIQGARRGIVPGATAAQCKAVVDGIMAIARINTYTVTVTPATITETSPTVTVQITVPLDQNGYFAPKIFAGKQIQHATSFDRERQSSE